MFYANQVLTGLQTTRLAICSSDLRVIYFNTVASRGEKFAEIHPRQLSLDSYLILYSLCKIVLR